MFSIVLAEVIAGLLSERLGTIGIQGSKRGQFKEGTGRGFNVATGFLI